SGPVLPHPPYNDGMSTPLQRRPIARGVIIALVGAWIIMLVVIGVDLVELKREGPPRLTPPTDSVPADQPAAGSDSAVDD
ncbi:MAG: hypothetical protein KDA21_00215, partial [Phycisphaerales bacterium]|nr:hypothetical protein [Phycisphaerales bacterium]